MQRKTNSVPVWLSGCMRATLAFMLAACTAGGIVETTDGVPGTPTDSTRTPTVQRAAISVRVSVDPADAAIAQQAGISVGGLTIRLTSQRPGDPGRTAVTAADGTTRFDNLLEGVYQASVERRLTAAEVARLPAGDRDASVFAGSGSIILSPPAAASLAIDLVGARRGSVVISEIFANYGPSSTPPPNYVYGSYVEVYNNSDTTVYLDGMLLTWTPVTWHWNSTPGGECSASNKIQRLDSTYVYLNSLLAFPGTGRDYPIRPGEAKVVAMDAMNHRAAAPEKEQVDLSAAPFEQFWTDGDIDNPFSVNMVRRYGSSGGIFGRGLMTYGGGTQHILLAREALATLEETSERRCGGNGCFDAPIGRIPSRYLLDLWALESHPDQPGFAVASVQFPRCVPWTSPFYDRAPAPLVATTSPLAIRRRTVGFTTDGREILQRTRNSARDLERAVPLQRSLAR